MNSKVVFIQGAFEIINYGHVLAFEWARKHGDYLIVGLNTNRLLEEYKKRKAVLPWEQKAHIIQSFRTVSKVVPCDNFSPIAQLYHFRVDVYVISEEWLSTKNGEIEYMKSVGGKTVICPRFPEVVSTSMIKARLLDEAMSGSP